jgi:hypothetical protein
MSTKESDDRTNDTLANESESGHEEANGLDPYSQSALRIEAATRAEHTPKVRVKITVKRPKSEKDVFTVHPTIDPVEIYAIIDEHDKSVGANGVEYLVSEKIVASYGYPKQFQKKLAFPAVTRYGQPFLWTIPCTDESGRRSGSATSQEQFAWRGRQRRGGKTTWQLLAWDGEDGVFTSTLKQLNQQPDWPEGLDTIEDWLRLAYPSTSRFLRPPLTEDQKKLLHELLVLDDDGEE